MKDWVILNLNRRVYTVDHLAHGQAVGRKFIVAMFRDANISVKTSDLIVSSVRLTRASDDICYTSSND